MTPFDVMLFCLWLTTLLFWLALGNLEGAGSGGDPKKVTEQGQAPPVAFGHP